MKNILLLISVSIVALFSLALASCGDDSDSDSNTTGLDRVAVEKDLGTFKLGSVLPESGSLAYLGPPMIKATELAVKEINEADKGIQIELLAGDSGGDPAIAGNLADRHIADRVNGIVGAAASGISLSIIDDITAQEIVMISPSNTSTSFTDYDDGGYYFRTAPSDVLQGRLLAELVTNGGSSSLVILNRKDDYGEQLAAQTKMAFEEAGGEVREVIGFDFEAVSFEAEAQKAAATGAEAVVLIAFDEGTQLIRSLIERNMGPDDVEFYISDGLSTEDLGEIVSPSNPSAIAGIVSVVASSTPSTGEDTFLSRLTAYDSSITEFSFSNHSYDAVVVMALAALAANSIDPSVYVSEVNGVTKDGEKCSLFAECADLIKEGKNIDYDGASGPLEFLEPGEPGSGAFDVFRFNEAGVREKIDQVVL